MITFLYDLILYLSASVLVPYYLFRGIRYGKTRRGIRERLGWFSPELLQLVKGRKVIWVHAVSVGETRAAIPLFKALREHYPDAVLLLSNVTETGREMARKIPEVDICIFFPFDLSWIVRKVISLIKPRVIVLVETELWPNFLQAAKRQGVPVVLVNGRISDRSLPRYRMARRLLVPVLESLTSFCMQTDQDARRIKLLGAASGRVQVTGNMKFDMAPPQLDDRDVDRLRQELRLLENSLVWVAGSTHAGEEAILLDVYQRVREVHPQLCLILVPRHPERARSVCDELSKRNIDWTLKTAVEDRDQPMSPGGVMVVDTIGEMLKLYALADIVFVGGSLVPVGGHNILEASLLRKPVFYGSYMQNFKEIARLVRNAYGGIQVKNAEDLYQHIKILIENPDEAWRIGDNGYHLLAENRGATRKTLAEIDRWILD